MSTGISFDFDWLLDKPQDVAVVFAARMALRVAPLLAGLQGLRGGHAGDFGQDVALPAFRSMAASWVAGQYPAHGDAIADAGDAAYAVAQHAPSAAARSAATAAGGAAAAAYNAATGDPNVGPAAVSTCLEAVEVTSLADFAATARADRELIDNGASASALAALPLWPAGQPDWVTETWQRLAEALLKENGDWQVWTNWYRARLEGGLVNEALEVARVSIAEEVWQQGPRAVNAEIARLAAEPGNAAG